MNGGGGYLKPRARGNVADMDIFEYINNLHTRLNGTVRSMPSLPCMPCMPRSLRVWSQVLNRLLCQGSTPSSRLKQTLSRASHGVDFPAFRPREEAVRRNLEGKRDFWSGVSKRQELRQHWRSYYECRILPAIRRRIRDESRISENYESASEWRHPGDMSQKMIENRKLFSLFTTPNRVAQ